MVYPQKVPPMDETGKPKGPSDTGERRVRAAAREGAREALENVRYTPPPVFAEGRMFDIAKQVFDREMPAHRLQCITDGDSGPVCRLAKELGERIDTMETTIEGMKMERAEQRGANREIAKDAAKATTLRAAAISAILSLLVGIGMFALNRAFPMHGTHTPIGAKAP